MSKTKYDDTRERRLKNDRPKKGHCDQCGHKHGDDVLCPEEYWPGQYA